MKKLFISQPMNSRSDAGIERVRQQAISEAKKMLNEDVDVIDSYIKDAPHYVKPLWLLGESLKLLSTADVVYFAEGWEAMRGCRIEHLCAQEYGIEILEKEVKHEDSI